MRILVTGAAGFVGSALLPQLREHEVTALIRPGGRSLPRSASIGADLGKPLDHAVLPPHIDAVIHLAQSRWSKAFPEGAEDAFAVNVASTAALADWARSAGAIRFCLISTGSVYDPYDGRLTEDAALAPGNFYGATKLAAENLLRPYSSLFTTCVLRLFFPYGPGQEARLIPDLVERVRSGLPITLPRKGDGMVITPSFVDDVAAVIVRATEEGWSGTFNVAAPTALTIREIGETIGRLLDKPPSFEHDAKDGTGRIVPDLSRLAAHWDMNRFTNLADGLSRTIGR
jgi:UDP-glucose 4-epimerase